MTNEEMDREETKGVLASARKHIGRGNGKKEDRAVVFLADRLDEAVRLLEDARAALDGSDDIDAFLLTWADDAGVFLAKARP